VRCARETPSTRTGCSRRKGLPPPGPTRRSWSGESTSSPLTAPCAPRAKSAPRWYATWQPDAVPSMSPRPPPPPVQLRRGGGAGAHAPMEPRRPNRLRSPRPRRPQPSLREPPDHRAGDAGAVLRDPRRVRKSTNPEPPTCRRLKRRRPLYPRPPRPRPPTARVQGSAASCAACGGPKPGLPAPPGARSPGGSAGSGSRRRWSHRPSWRP